MSQRQTKTPIHHEVGIPTKESQKTIDIVPRIDYNGTVKFR